MPEATAYHPARVIDPQYKRKLRRMTIITNLTQLMRLVEDSALDGLVVRTPGGEAQGELAMVNFLDNWTDIAARPTRWQGLIAITPELNAEDLLGNEALRRLWATWAELNHMTLTIEIMAANGECSGFSVVPERHDRHGTVTMYTKDFLWQYFDRAWGMRGDSALPPSAKYSPWHDVLLGIPGLRISRMPRQNATYLESWLHEDVLAAELPRSGGRFGEIVVLDSKDDTVRATGTLTELRPTKN